MSFEVEYIDAEYQNISAKQVKTLRRIDSHKKINNAGSFVSGRRIWNSSKSPKEIGHIKQVLKRASL